MGAILPDDRSIALANQLSSGSSAVNDFFRETFGAILSKHHAVEDYSTTLEALDETTKITRIRAKCLEEISEKTWKGGASQLDLDKIKAGSINYLDAAAMEGLQHLNAQFGADHQVLDITMVYYIDENSQFNRGYLINENVVTNKDDELIVDQMFHSWLISHDMASNDAGIICRRLKDGTVTKQAVRREDILKLLEDPRTGLHTTAKKIDPKLDLTIRWAPPGLETSLNEAHTNHHTSQQSGG